MIDVVLFQPEIPPNTGNIIRLCANTGSNLHLIEPLGFALDHRKLRRAGLDYREWTNLQVHSDFKAYVNTCKPLRVWAFTTRAQRCFADVCYASGDALLFGPETRGLPAALLERLAREQWLRIPMRPASRSLNLSNAVAVVVYEAWRQRGFIGGI